MPAKHTRNGVYAQRLRDIRPYVDFDFNLTKKLTSSQRAKINKYHKEIAQLKARPHQVYRPRNKENLAPAQKFAQHEKRLPGLKVAFVPNNGKEQLRIRVTPKGEVLASTKYVHTRGLLFNLDALAVDPLNEVARVIEDDDSTHYAIRCGKYEIPRTASPELIGSEVARLMSRYSEGGARWHRAGHLNNDWQEWLHGLNGYKFDNQASALQYMEQKLQAKRKLQKLHKKQRQQCTMTQGGKRCQRRLGHEGSHRFGKSNN